ncbi:MAG: GTPase ObgE, partial [Legionellales bacterium]|nr:GTPase ObgE [Legionellales bacterium]
IRIELERYDEKLSNKERWLLLNKSDLLSDEAIEELKLFFKDKLGDKVKIFIISALTKDGCQELIYKINDWIMKRKESD